jgi:hypothetical protein
MGVPAYQGHLFCQCLVVRPAELSSPHGMARENRQCDKPLLLEFIFKIIDPWACSNFASRALDRNQAEAADTRIVVSGSRKLLRTRLDSLLSP